MAPTLSAALIIKNEEKYLPDCLESIRDIANEIVIVDTGSNDNSIFIANKYNARVFNFDWIDDFSAARNFAMSHCTSDWILIIDADERFMIDDSELLKSAITSNKIDVYFLPVIDARTGNKHPSIRLLNRSAGINYVGKIHELPNFGSHTQAYSDIRIMHLGYHGSGETEGNRNKHDRNIRILKQSLASDPNNAGLLFHTGLEYEGAGNIEEAINYYKQAYGLTSGDGIPPILRSLVMALQTKELYSDALELIADGIKKFPEFNDLYYLGGSVLQRLGKYEQAMQSFIKCIELGPPPPNYPSFGGVSDFLALRGIGVCLLNLGRSEQAKKVLEDALTFFPEDKFTLDALKNISKDN